MLCMYTALQFIHVLVTRGVPRGITLNFEVSERVSKHPLFFDVSGSHFIGMIMSDFVD